MKRRLTMVGAALALLAGTFAAGRYSRPARVEERIVTQEVVRWRERVVVQEREVKVRDERRSGRRTTRVLRLPDGTVSRETVDERVSTTSSVSKTNSDSTSTSAAAADRSSESVRVVTTPVPRWGVGMLAGVDLRLRRPWAGAYVTREFLGPLTIGVFGANNGTAGLILGARF